MIPFDPAAPMFSSREVAHYSAIPLRQLQRWDETHLISVRQVGHKRQYSEQDFFRVLLARELQARGFSVQAIRTIWNGIRASKGVVNPRWLLTNGERTVLLEHSDVVLAFLEQRRSPRFVLISLDAIKKRIEEVKGKVQALHPRKAPAREYSSLGEYFAERREQWA